MKALRLSLVSLALCLSGLAGCNSRGSIGGLNVTIVDLKPAAATAPAGQAVLTLRFTNENVVAIGVDSSTHQLFLNGTRVGKAESLTPLGLPPMAAATQVVTMQFDNPALVRQLANDASQKTASYQLVSELLVKDGDDKYVVKTTEKGALDLRALAGAK
jgi:LEA14-like dessication related protein